MGGNAMLLAEGDIIELLVGHTVYATVPVHFLGNKKYEGCFDMMENAQVRIGKELTYLAGRYLVVKTCTDGGGQGSEAGGSYYHADGHHVFCQKLDVKNEIKVNFYQTGAFTVKVRDIQPVGKATLTWKELGIPVEGAAHAAQ